MPRAADGTMTLPAGNPVVAGTTASATVHNNTLEDIRAELQDSLSRSGKGGMTATFKIADGEAAAPGIAFTGDTNTGLYRIGADNVGLSVGGTKVLDASATAVASAQPVKLPDGTAAAPALTFTSDPNSGLYSAGADQVGIAVNGVNAATFAASTLTLAGTLAVGSLPASNTAVSTSCGNFSTTSASLTDVTNLSAAITTSGRPVLVMLISDGTGSSTYVSDAAQVGHIAILRGASKVADWIIQSTGAVPIAFIHFDAPVAGTYTYKAQASITGGATITFRNAHLRVFEL